MKAKTPHERIWKSVFSALGAELHEQHAIQGLSGMNHPVQAVARDDNTKRLIIVSAEANPRVASLMQFDVQAKMPHLKVLVARPVLFDIGDLAGRVLAAAGEGSLNPTVVSSGFKELFDPEKGSQLLIDRLLDPHLKPLFDTAGTLKLPGLNVVLSLIQQLAHTDFEKFIPSDLSKLDLGTLLGFLMSTLSIDSTESDRAHGVCPIPLYDFSGNDWELLQSGRRPAAVRERLKELGIFQYFYPAPDHLLLGIADQGIAKEKQLIEAAKQSPILGHPFGEPEIIERTSSIPKMLDELKGAGYLAEMDHEVVVTETGRELRQITRLRPREGLISKISRLFSVRVNVDTANVRTISMTKKGE